ncbi:MAG: hypothetical protein HQL15_06315 [Candidatus Omnitrophica bacterium]|nr:hypothetical protein [Candidatus Omnitrophota bacterium]
MFNLLYYLMNQRLSQKSLFLVLFLIGSVSICTAQDLSSQDSVSAKIQEINRMLDGVEQEGSSSFVSQQVSKHQESSEETTSISLKPTQEIPSMVGSGSQETATAIVSSDVQENSSVKTNSQTYKREITHTDETTVDAIGDTAVSVQLDTPTHLTPTPIAEVPPGFTPSFKISGLVHTSMGIYPKGKLEFSRANGSLTERNYSLVSRDQLFNGENTYDPAIYSSLNVNVDASLTKYVSMHLNLVADPWSYVGKSKEVVVTNNLGQKIKVQYLFWGNTGYTLGQSGNTITGGDSFIIPEQKVNGNIVPATTAYTHYDKNSTYPPAPTHPFAVPDMKLDYTFQPIREAWVDIKPDQSSLIRIFPLAYQDQSLTTDDPFKLSNNTIWWEESPWIWDWTKGNYDSSNGAYTKGIWDRSLSFYTRDSNLVRLTGLRGVSLKIKPDEDNFLEATIASPKTLWQDYQDVRAVPASVRAKHFFGDQAYVGSVTNAHQGYANGELDAENYVQGFDGAILPLSWLMVNGEYSLSKSRYDITQSDFTTKKDGNAYYASLMTTSSPVEGMVKKDYFALAPDQKGDNFFKTRLFFSRMDENFESTLANYRETRKDSFWSRHLTFYPDTYRFMPGTVTSFTQDDLAPFADGTGIDYGRNVIGWRGEADLMQGKVHGLVDFRRVMNNNYKHIETVSRTQWMLQATDKLTLKTLLLWQSMPKTQANVDPYLITNLGTGDPLINTSVGAYENPSIKTGTLGARYEITKWAIINGVWEYTNDSTIATNNFPQAILSDAGAGLYTQDGKLFSQSTPYVYNSYLFDQPPYNYYNIFKTGLEFIPAESWHIYLDYTRNPRKFSGNIDDNMNHFGFETSWVPTKNVGFFARYTFAKWYDIQNLINNAGTSDQLKYRSYDNLYLETRLLLPADIMLSIMYGVGPTYNIKTSSADPLLSYYTNPVFVTQHIVRLTCEKKF